MAFSAENINMLNNKFKGTLCAVLAAVTYGMNPCFGIPLYNEGLTPWSVLFYRFSSGTLLLLCVMLIGKKQFHMPANCIIPAVCAGILMAATCIFWFLTFRIMDSGIAAAMLFVYPVMVALIMFVFFKEKISIPTLIGMILAIAGVVILCNPSPGSRICGLGILFIMLSALTYAMYIVAVKKSRLANIPPETLTFYAMLFSIPIYLIPLKMGADLQMIPSLKALANAVGLGLFPSLISFLFAAIAIKYIGPTKTAVFGALEPITAVIIGVVLFNEKLSLLTVAGIILILAAVNIVICSQADKQKNNQLENKS